MRALTAVTWVLARLSLEFVESHSTTVPLCSSCSELACCSQCNAHFPQVFDLIPRSGWV